MRKKIYSVLKADFLIGSDSMKNWRFILFVSLLAIIMIASSHSADQKVHTISRLNEEVKELKSEYVSTRSQLQSLKLESFVVEKVKSKGLQPSDEPARKIIVKSSKQ